MVTKMKLLMVAMMRPHSPIFKKPVTMRIRVRRREPHKVPTIADVALPMACMALVRGD